MSTSLRTDVEDVIECKICLEPMTDSRVLFCHHSFCFKCLEPLVVNQEVKCPKCRKSTCLRIGGLHHLQRDFTVNKLAASYKNPHAHGTPLVCATCPTQSNPVWFCTDCQDYLCQSCNDTHGKVQLFESHNVVCVEEKCPRHPRKDLSYICTDCHVFVCGACIITAHQEHTFENADKFLEDLRQDLHSRLDGMYRKAGISTQIANAVEKVNIPNLEADIVERFARIKKEISESANLQILRVKQEEATLQALLVSQMKEFDGWVDSFKKIDSFMSKVAELKANCGTLVDRKSASKEEVLNGVKVLSSEITTTIDQLACNSKALSMFCSLEIPKDFSTPNSDASLVGTINKTSDIHPDVQFYKSNNGKQLLAANQNAAKIAEGKQCGGAFPGVQCDGCYYPVVGTWFECETCPNYNLCSTCKTLRIHTDHEMHSRKKACI